MVTITIDEADNNSEMADKLRHIADLIDEGYSSGAYPDWQLTGEQQFTEETNQ